MMHLSETQIQTQTNLSPVKHQNNFSIAELKSSRDRAKEQKLANNKRVQPQHNHKTKPKPMPRQRKMRHQPVSPISGSSSDNSLDCKTPLSIPSSLLTLPLPLQVSSPTPAALISPSSSISTSASTSSSASGTGSCDSKSADDRRKRLAANLRERKRMNLLNSAYDLLRHRLIDANNKSKYDVLVQAKEYIQALAAIIQRANSRANKCANSNSSHHVASSSSQQQMNW